MTTSTRVSPLRSTLVIAAIGVVFGDIGTSPLYALRECFTPKHGVSVTPDHVIGSVSLIIWFLILIVAIKYVILVMNADNKGEGGILALLALVHRVGSKRVRELPFLSILGILGAALLFSNGVITPAISVLSAIEGVSITAPVFGKFVIPLALLVLTALFMIQSHGTSKIGMLFGPVMLLWFITLGVLGFFSMLCCPHILKAFNPVYALNLMLTSGLRSLGLLSAAILALTGAEVLYADMGHFGKTPIRKAWFFIVFPALVLNYLGQGAKLLHDGSLPANLFYSLSPAWFLIPLIVIATLATIIASQAVISGAFSLFRQAVQLGFWPRIKILHTSKSNIGQVYIPFVNYLLYVVIFLLIAGFRESGNLASAYGITVAATMLITSVLIVLIAKTLWKVSLALIIPIAAVILALDTSLLIANLSKFASGGWIIVLIAMAFTILMTTWIRGRKLLQKNVVAAAVPLADFVRDIATRPDVIRPLKTAVFLSGNATFVPRALLHNFKHNGIIHSVNLIVCVQNVDLPYVPGSDKVSVDDLGQGIYAICFKYGFMESPDIPRDIAELTYPILGDPLSFSYFLGKESLVLTKRGTLPFWRKHIFLLMTKNALGASTFFNLPVNRVVELGVQIEF